MLLLRRQAYRTICREEMTDSKHGVPENEGCNLCALESEGYQICMMCLDKECDCGVNPGYMRYGTVKVIDAEPSEKP